MKFVIPSLIGIGLIVILAPYDGKLTIMLSVITSSMSRLIGPKICDVKENI